MKKFVALCTIAALAACSNDEKAKETIAEEVAVAASVTGVEPGTYEVSSGENQASQIELKADGTFVDTVDGEKTGSGKWTSTENQICFDGDGADQEEQCWKNSPVNPVGSWTATSASGETVTIRPLAAVE